MRLHQGDFRLVLDDYFQVQSENSVANSLHFESKANSVQTKSVAKAVLFSSAIPGSGEFYSGSYLKGILFMAVEAASWPLYFHYNNRGNDLEAQFQGFADNHWVEEDYWNWLSQVSGISVNDMDALREYESENYTHFLPEVKNQQYYENIGKYNQFNIGWQDTQTGNGRDSQLRDNYVHQRKDANDNFQRATNLTTVLMFNHILSALDAGFTTRGFNRRITTSLRMQNMRYGSELVPSLLLGVTW
ncbi:MAG: hypothetical protein ACE5HO_15255 [bacterium]